MDASSAQSVVIFNVVITLHCFLIISITARNNSSKLKNSTFTTFLYSCIEETLLKKISHYIFIGKGVKYGQVIFSMRIKQITLTRISSRENLIVISRVIGIQTIGLVVKCLHTLQIQEENMFMIFMKIRLKKIRQKMIVVQM